MGNVLKSTHSRKSQKFKHTLIRLVDNKRTPRNPNESSARSALIQIEALYEDTHSYKIKEDLDKYGFPDNVTKIHHYQSHSFVYDTQKRGALWVLEYIDQNNFEKTSYSDLVQNQDEDLLVREDDNIPEEYAAQPSDYEKDKLIFKLFLASPKHYQHEQESHQSSLLLSNVLPAQAHFKTVVWSMLEMYIRDLVQKENCKLWVTSGPVFVEQSLDDRNSFMRYELLENNVAIPHYFFKLIVVETNKKDKRPDCWACVVVPNWHYEKPKKLNITNYEVSLESLTSATGLNLNKYDHLKLKYANLFKTFPFNGVDLRKRVDESALKPIEKALNKVEKRKMEKMKRHLEPK